MSTAASAAVIAWPRAPTAPAASTGATRGLLRAPSIRRIRRAKRAWSKSVPSATSAWCAAGSRRASRCARSKPWCSATRWTHPRRSRSFFRRGTRSAASPSWEPGRTSFTFFRGRMTVLANAMWGSRAYRWWMAALASAVAAGLLLWLPQWNQGLALTGMSRDVAWGLYIGQFTFFVGVAASAVTVVLPYYLHAWRAFGRVVILGELLAITSVVVAMLFVLVDLGRPDRLLNVLLHPSPSSLMFWDLLALAGYLGLNVILARAALAGPPAAWTRVMVLISIPWAVSIHTI